MGFWREASCSRHWKVEGMRRAVSAGGGVDVYGAAFPAPSAVAIGASLGSLGGFDLRTPAPLGLARDPQ